MTRETFSFEEDGNPFRTRLSRSPAMLGVVVKIEQPENSANHATQRVPRTVQIAPSHIVVKFGVRYITSLESKHPGLPHLTVVGT